MFNIEPEVYSHVSAALKAKFKGVSTSSEYVKSPAAFPHVTIIETDNYTTPAHLDSSDVERFSTVAYTVDVYSNKSSGKKSECKSIMAEVDAVMYSMNFTRLVMTPTPNLEDASIYRITAQYRAETDGTNIYRI